MLRIVIRLVCTTYNRYQARQALNIYESSISAAPKFTGSPVSFSPALTLLSTSTIFWRETMPHRTQLEISYLKEEFLRDCV